MQTMNRGALKWQERLQAKYPDLPIDISYFGPVIGTHLGEKHWRWHGYGTIQTLGKKMVRSHKVADPSFNIKS